MILPFIENIEPEGKIKNSEVIVTPAVAEQDRLRSGTSIHDAFDLKYIEFKEQIEKERFARELIASGK